MSVYTNDVYLKMTQFDLSDRSVNIVSYLFTGLFLEVLKLNMLLRKDVLFPLACEH